MASSTTDFVKTGKFPDVAPGVPDCGPITDDMTDELLTVLVEADDYLVDKVCDQLPSVLGAPQGVEARRAFLRKVKDSGRYLAAQVIYRKALDIFRAHKAATKGEEITAVA